jgi:hypothetical protein
MCSQGDARLRFRTPTDERRSTVTDQSDNASEGTPEAPGADLLGGLQRVPRRLGTLRGQLIIPYVLLTLVTAMVGDVCRHPPGHLVGA